MYHGREHGRSVGPWKASERHGGGHANRPLLGAEGLGSPVVRPK